MKFIETKIVNEIHDELVKVFSDTSDPISPPGLREYGLLDSAVTSSQSSLKGCAPLSVFDRATKLFFGIIQNHPFHNGNKRTALVAMLAFFRINKHYLECSDDGLFEFVVASAAASSALFGDASGERKTALITNWLKKHVHQGTRTPGPLRTTEFLKLVEEGGGRIRQKETSIVVMGPSGKSCRIGRDTRKLDGPVVNSYLNTIGMSYGRTGRLIEEFETSDRPDQILIREFRSVLDRLANA
jgi:death on curing protein